LSAAIGVVKGTVFIFIIGVIIGTSEVMNYWKEGEKHALSI